MRTTCWRAIWEPLFLLCLLWRQRFKRDGLAGILEDRPRSGRPKEIPEERETAIVEATIQTTPKDATHWSIRTMAASQKVSPATVQRIWKKHKLQPHRVENFKFSNDPEFAGKVRDIVGLYVNPPDKAVVLSVDEKSQIQALDRTQPILPLRPGLPERQTHDYERHGTTTLFAALNVPEGTVIGQCQPKHRHQEFLRFLDQIDASVEPELNIHLVLDNYGTHKAPGGEEMANATAPLSIALHADEFVVAQSDRTLVRRNHPQADSSRNIPQRPESGPDHQRLHTHL